MIARGLDLRLKLAITALEEIIRIAPHDRSTQIARRALEELKR